MQDEASREFDRGFAIFLERRYQDAADVFQRSADCSTDSESRLRALSLKATSLARLWRAEGRALAEAIIAQDPNHFNARQLLAALRAADPAQHSRLASRGMEVAAEPCRSYTELCRQIERLPAPPPGYAHVFRGQNADYGEMVPTALRRQRPRGDAVWMSFSWHLGVDLKRHEHGRDVDDEVMAFCVRAIAQHYGSGSEFLDVTHDKEVALWFALNEAWTDRVGALDPPSEMREIAYAIMRTPIAVTHHRPVRSGVFFVFLVPKWNGTARPEHGELIDLAERAPQSFRASERIRIQKACLVKAGPALLDLSSFYACDPIPVERPMADAPRLDDETAKLFPGPSHDPWFRRLLNIPMVCIVDDEKKELTVDRPLVLTTYHSANKAEVARQASGVWFPPALELMRWDTGSAAAMPELTRRQSRETAAWLNVPPHRADWSEATHLFLEAPAFADMPALSSGRWNVGLLGHGLAESADAVDLFAGHPCGAHSLCNVLLELSPLEIALWEDPWEIGSVLLAVSLVRNGNRFVLRTFITERNRGMRILDPPACYEFDGKSGFSIWSPGERRVQAGKGSVWHEVFFFGVLNILRKLSPGKTIDPIVAYDRDQRRYALNVEEGPSLRLMRASSPDGRDWHFLRTVGGRPYAPVRLRISGPEKLDFVPRSSVWYESAVPWAEVDPAALRRHLSI